MDYIPPPPLNQGVYLTSLHGRESTSEKTTSEIENRTVTDDEKENNPNINNFMNNIISSVKCNTKIYDDNLKNINDSSTLKSPLQTISLNNIITKTTCNYNLNINNNVKLQKNETIEIFTDLPLINPVESPSKIIFKLKKGQRLKDGMILMLTGQVDQRKQLLLGAQVYIIYSYSYCLTTYIKLATYFVLIHYLCLVKTSEC